MHLLPEREPGLEALRQERCFDVLVLSSQLWRIWDSLTFLESSTACPATRRSCCRATGGPTTSPLPTCSWAAVFYGVGHDHLRIFCGGCWASPAGTR